MEKKYKPTTREELKALCDDLSVNLADIDTSLITDMSSLFKDSKRTNEQFEGIGFWNMSNVEDVSLMFYGARLFNQPLEKWDVSKVKNMESMFRNAKTFNQPLNSWDVSKVENMRSMFDDANSFNQPLNSWDVSSVKNMGGMFFNAKSFNQSLNDWNVSRVENMCAMFYGAKSFNQPIDMWKFKKLEYASCFFGRNFPFYKQGLKKALGDNSLYKLGFDTVKGEYILTRCEEVYHIDSIFVLKKNFKKAIDDAKESLEKRLRELKNQEHYLEMIKANANKVIVLTQDSYDAGNCVSGTALFCRRHKISLKKGVRGDILLKKAENDVEKQLAVNALVHSLRRNGIVLSA